jgi:RsmE family RNA methyltransferase
LNLVLFESHEIGVPLPVSDRRAQHVLRVLKRHVGESFDAGVVNGPRGKGTVTAITAEALELSFAPRVAAMAPAPITMIVGLPRPQTARDILRDGSTLGLAALHFVRTDKAEPGYALSTLWSSGEWRRHVLAGAEQAFDTRIPEVTRGQTLRDVMIAALQPGGPAAPACRLVLDNYEAARSLSEVEIDRGSRVVVAIGSERGWSAAERELFRSERFQLVHLGDRVLRTETAFVAALTLVRAKLGLM